MSKGVEYIKLGNIFTSIRNGANIKQFDDAGGIPITRIETLSNDLFNRDRLGYANIVDANRYSDYLLQDDDILMSHINSLKYLGRAVLYKKKNNETIIHGMNLLRLKPDAKILSSSYIAYYFSTNIFKKHIVKIAKKSVNQASITVSDLKEIKVPVFSLSVQYHIAATLDKANEMIALRKKQLSELDALAESVFYELFGDPVKNEKGWEKEDLGKLCNIGTGGTPDRERDNEYYNGTIPWIKTTEVQNCSIHKTEEYITELALKNSNCKIYPVETILIAMYGQGKTRGQVARLKIEATTNQACAAIMPSSKVNNVYLYSILRMTYNEIRALGRGGNQENLNLSLVKAIKIPLPPLSLQTRFATIIEKIEEQKAQVRKALQESEDLFQRLMQDLFRPN